jgi:hypothetical protein
MTQESGNKTLFTTRNMRIAALLGVSAVVLGGCGVGVVDWSKIDDMGLFDPQIDEFPKTPKPYTYSDLIAAADAVIAEKYVMSPAEFFDKNPGATPSQYMDYLQKDLAAMDSAQDKLRAVVHSFMSDPAYAAEKKDLSWLLTRMSMWNYFTSETFKNLAGLFSNPNPSRDQLEQAFHSVEAVQNDAVKSQEDFSKAFNKVDSRFPIVKSIDELAEIAKRAIKAPVTK